MIKSEIADYDNLTSLSKFYAKIPEYGSKNILSNNGHLFWKHLENPYGKSYLFFEIIDNQIISAIILQARPSTFRNKSKCFLACDMAILPEFRKLSRFTNLWKEVKTFCNKEFGTDYMIFHSSNNMSEPLYSSLLLSKKVTILKPYVFIPGINLKHLFRRKNSLNEFKDTKEDQFYSWRFNENSQVEYFTLNGYDKCDDGGTKIFYRIQKFHVFNCLIILNDATSSCMKCDLRIQRQILQAMFKHRSIVAIMYARQTLGKESMTVFKYWHKIPNKFSPYTFPIYSSNPAPNDYSNEFHHFFLEDLDVL